MNTTRLDARVAGVNAANAEAMRLYPILADIFRPLVGQKITKADGSLLKRVADLVPKFPYSQALHVYKHTSDYSLAWVVKTCETSPGRNPGDGIACYYEAMVYVGNMQGGVLTGLCNPPALRADYTAAAVREKRAAFEVARKAFEDARGELHPFGEHDN